MGLDKVGANFFYADNESLWLCNVQYVESVCREGMRLVVAQHAEPVKQIDVDLEDSMAVATMDSSGLLIISSGITK